MTTVQFFSIKKFNIDAVLLSNLPMVLIHIFTSCLNVLGSSFFVVQGPVQDLSVLCLFSLLIYSYTHIITHQHLTHSTFLFIT